MSAMSDGNGLLALAGYAKQQGLSNAECEALLRSLHGTRFPSTTAALNALDARIEGVKRSRPSAS